MREWRNTVMVSSKALKNVTVKAFRVPRTPTTSANSVDHYGKSALPPVRNVGLSHKTYPENLF